MRAFVHGVGSVLMPPPLELRDLVPQNNPEQSIAEDWRSVGRHISVALSEFEMEHGIAETRRR